MNAYKKIPQFDFVVSFLADSKDNNYLFTCYITRGGNIAWTREHLKNGFINASVNSIDEIETQRIDKVSYSAITKALAVLQAREQTQY